MTLEEVPEAAGEDAVHADAELHEAAEVLAAGLEAEEAELDAGGQVVIVLSKCGEDSGREAGVHCHLLAAEPVGLGGETEVAGDDIGIALACDVAVGILGGHHQSVFLPGDVESQPEPVIASVKVLHLDGAGAQYFLRCGVAQ